MNPRPRIKVPITPLDLVVEGASWLAFVALWTVTLIYYFQLPETIPTHFNAAGTPDGHGGKVMFLLLPFIGTVLFIALTVLVHYPHLFNFPTKVTEENAPRLYQIGVRLLTILKLNLCVVFTVIGWMSGATAMGQAAGLSAWFLPIAIGLIVIPIVVSIVQMMRLSK